MALLRSKIEIPDRDHVQEHINITIAFCARERDSLVLKNSFSPEVQERLQALDFMIDELAIKALERGSIYTC